MARTGYMFLLESDKELMEVKVAETTSIEEAIGRLRGKYNFSEWRIINVSETLITNEELYA